MKKLIAMLISIVLILSLSVATFAATGGSVVLKASATEVKQGDTVTVSVSLKDVDAISSMGLEFSYDKNVFEAEGEWKDSSAFINAVEDGKAALAFTTAKKVSGEIFVLTLKAKTNAAIGKKDISIKYTAKNSTAVVVEGTSKAQIGVVCKTHNFSNWTVVTKATCTSNGSEKRTCTVAGCGISETRTVNKLGHTFGEWTVETAATCTAKGVEKRTCTVAGCGAFETREINKLSHSYGEWKADKEATCDAEGVQVRECSKCGNKNTKAITKTEHKYGDFVVVTVATETATGLKEAKCSVCGDTKSEVIPQLEVTSEPSDLTDSTVSTPVVDVDTDTDIDNDNDSNSTLWIILIVLLAVAAITVVAVIITKKKK